MLCLLRTELRVSDDINLENASKMLLTVTAIFDEENRDEITGKEQI